MDCAHALYRWHFRHLHLHRRAINNLLPFLFLSVFEIILHAAFFLLFPPHSARAPPGFRNLNARVLRTTIRTNNSWRARLSRAEKPTGRDCLACSSTPTFSGRLRLKMSWMTRFSWGIVLESCGSERGKLLDFEFRDRKTLFFGCLSGLGSAGRICHAGSISVFPFLISAPDSQIGTGRWE